MGLVSPWSDPHSRYSVRTELNCMYMTAGVKELVGVWGKLGVKFSHLVSSVVSKNSSEHTYTPTHQLNDFGSCNHRVPRSSEILRIQSKIFLVCDARKSTKEYTIPSSSKIVRARLEVFKYP